MSSAESTPPFCSTTVRLSCGGLAGVLMSAIVKQVLASTFDDSHRYAGTATERLLATGVPNNGLLYGPRSPNYGKD